ncbi:MAG TPA: SPOR domain-containing protein [Terriglobia bacterium]|jgi:cell division septation protein DedD
MMEEQTTWKGHTFTLFVFTGIVMLCSIFFILGMLVGRAEGQKLASASTASGKAEAKAAPKEEKEDFTFYDSVKKQDQTAALQPAPQLKAEPDPEPAAAPATLDPPEKTGPDPEPSAVKPPPPPPAPANAISYQIGALKKAADAYKLLDEVKKKGFRALILAPADGDPNPWYRVRVGPFTDMAEAEEVKQKLKNEKYDPQPKK